MSQKLLSAAVVIGALRVNITVGVFQTHAAPMYWNKLKYQSYPNIYVIDQTIYPIKSHKIRIWANQKMFIYRLYDANLIQPFAYFRHMLPQCTETSWITNHITTLM